MIGGSGEKKTLRLVAKYADACNLFGGERGGRPQTRGAEGPRESEGRDYGEIEKAIIWGTNPLDDVDGFLAETD